MRKRLFFILFVMILFANISQVKEMTHIAKSALTMCSGEGNIVIIFPRGIFDYESILFDL